MKLQLE